MIIIKMSGGLGNQLQQYALYEKFRFLGKEAKVDLDWFQSDIKKYKTRELELTKFKKVTFEIATKEEKENLIGKGSLKEKISRMLFPKKSLLFREQDMYHPEIFDMTDGYLEGYWACEKYYADILPLLREKLIFTDSNNSKNLETALQMQQEFSVSVHIRRGDYLDPENEALFGNICTQAYYKSAISYMKKINTNARFYLFSDDPDYVKTEYSGPEYVVVDWNKDTDAIYDMYLMSMCDHNICANSTFSFWGARLNRNAAKTIIRPLKHKNSQYYDPEQMKELWLGWTLIDGDGRVL